MIYKNQCIVALFFLFISDAYSDVKEVYINEFGNDKILTISGSENYERIGFDVNEAGDVNGDGIDDFIISSPFSGDSNSRFGYTYVIFGNSNGFPDSMETSEINGENGFKVIGAEKSKFSGYSASSAGDINNDGLNDIAIGVWLENTVEGPSTGKVVVVYGSDEPFSGEININEIDGVNGFSIIGARAGDRLGTYVNYAGDVNDDGIDDIIISNGNINLKGAIDSSYLIYGRSGNFPNTLQLSSLSSKDGVIIDALMENVSIDKPVSYAGDINADGIDDIIIGADRYDVNGVENSGKSYIIFGKKGGLESPFNLGSIDGENGFTINGQNIGDNVSSSVSNVGDVNGDGIEDVIIGGIGLEDPDMPDILSPGGAYVLYGNNEGFEHPFDPTNLNGSNGFVIIGEEQFDGFGRRVSGAGDINGDGYDDIIIYSSAQMVDDSFLFNGRVYLIYSKKNGFPAKINLSNRNSWDGIIFYGQDDNDDFGSSLSFAGDVNNDGLDDLIIGAHGVDIPFPLSFQQGQSFVYFGDDSLFRNSFE